MYWQLSSVVKLRIW